MPMTPQEIWLADLERERNDLSYKRPSSPPVTSEPTPAERRARDRMFYNAGRYSAGARDKAATAAHAKLERDGLL